METKIVIIGAGYAGVLTAKKLEKKLKKNKDVSITIIDRNPFNTMLTELHEVAACRVDEDSIRMDLDKIFAGRKVNVVLDSVENIDFETQTVVGTNNSYNYDYVVIATGSKPTFFGIEGAKENTYTLWSYDDAVILRDRIHDVFLEAAKEADLEKRKELLTFYVVGAGFTGVEMMGELAEYVPILCAEYHIPQEHVTLVNVDAMDRTVPVLPVKLSNKVQRRLEKMGVEVLLNAKVKKITEDSITLEVNGQEQTNAVNTVIWTAGIESSEVSTESGKELDAAQRGGRIQTDEFLRALNHEHVYVVGDNLWIVVDGEERPVPQMVENAEHSAGTAAKNIIKSIKGDSNLEAYNPSFHGMMVCIGGRYGVAHVGAGKFFINLPSFFAMFSKHFINLVYFVQVLGWNKCFSYMKHEFFTIRHKRSFVGGNFSNRTVSFVVTPFRIWLGMVWVFEAVKKWGEGWFDFSQGPKLAKFFGYADEFYKGVLGADNYTGLGLDMAKITGAADAGSAASGAADAATAASGVADAATAASGAADVASSASGAGTGGGAEAVGNALKFNFNFLGLFQIILVSAVPINEAIVLGDIAAKINVPLMNWFINTLILSTDGMQFFMQAFIVIMEFLIGLALIGGLFTTMAAGMSVFLQFMFLMTTGLYFSNIWMFVGGIAVLFSGQTFGLDYWVTPVLKKWWTKIPFVKKWYLYND